MKDVRRTGEKSEDRYEFTKLDMRTYSQRAFSMFSGNRQIITIRFHNRILDTIVERFDAKGVQYSKVNDWYFKATAEVEVSDPFYGWLLGLGKHTKILYPEDWALMRQSKNELPFIIDTPFARIDTEHRANITKLLFKELNGQLFVLSTNEELRHEHVQALDEQIAKVYMLEYGEDKRTSIIEGSYFEV